MESEDFGHFGEELLMEEHPTRGGVPGFAAPVSHTQQQQAPPAFGGFPDQGPSQGPSQGPARGERMAGPALRAPAQSSANAVALDSTYGGAKPQAPQGVSTYGGPAPRAGGWSSYAAMDMPAFEEAQRAPPKPLQAYNPAPASSSGGSSGTPSDPGLSTRSSTGSGVSEAPSAGRIASVPWTSLSDVEVFDRGSFGVVYKAQWRGITVAVKVPTTTNMLHAVPGAALRGPAAAFAAQAEADLLAEAHTMAAVPTHPHVLPLLGTTGAPVGLMFPFVANGSAEAQFVGSAGRPAKARHVVRWCDAVRLMQQAAAGVLHLHSEGVVHRDLAARNVLLDGQLHAQVSDFGLARVKDAARGAGGTAGSAVWGSGGTGTMSHVGPVKYEAPECLAVMQSGAPKPYSPSTDVYSFGVFMYEVTAGMEPWLGYNLVQAWQAVAGGYRLTAPDGDGVVAALMTECWHPDPKARPRMADIVARLAAHLDSGAVPGGTVAEVQRDAERLPAALRPALPGTKGAPPAFLTAPPRAVIEATYVDAAALLESGGGEGKTAPAPPPPGMRLGSPLGRLQADVEEEEDADAYEDSAPLEQRAASSPVESRRRKGGPARPASPPPLRVSKRGEVEPAASHSRLDGRRSPAVRGKGKAGYGGRDMAELRSLGRAPASRSYGSKGRRKGAPKVAAEALSLKVARPIGEEEPAAAAAAAAGATVRKSASVRPKKAKAPHSRLRK